MNKKYALSFIILILPCYTITAIATMVSTAIQFSNDTNQQVTQTMAPYLDNFARYVHATHSYDTVSQAPKVIIEPYQQSTAKIAYDSRWNWYGMNQYAYNYMGRSSKYGCFITEIRLTNFFGSTEYIVISSYRQDPDHLDDYLMCTVDSISNNQFNVHFKSTLATIDNKLDDSKRYSIIDPYSFLNTITYYTINKPIQLWTDPDTRQTLVIKPNQNVPQLILNDSLVAAQPNKVRTISVTNNSSETVVAGPQLLDKFSRLNSEYYIYQPAEIKAGETQNIKIAMPDSGYYSIARFSYHIQDDHSELNGCYITTTNGFNILSDRITQINSFFSTHLKVNLVASSVNTLPSISGKKLACLPLDEDKVFLYDAPTKNSIIYSICSNDPFNCISYLTKENDPLSHAPRNKIDSAHELGIQIVKFDDNLIVNFPIDPVHNYKREDYLR